MQAVLATSANQSSRRREINPAALEQLQGKVVTDCGSGLVSLLVFIGDKLGMFRVLGERGPCSPSQLARDAGLNERMTREWLAAMAMSGYVDYDGESDRYALTPEQHAVFADEQSSALMQGEFDLIYSVFQDEPKLRDAFRHDNGLAWGEHHACLFCGVNRSFGALYRGSLVEEWLPAIDGLAKRLEAGIDVADVGCGLGASAILMAQAYPNSRFFGFDNHAASIAQARDAARVAGVADRLRFEQGSANEYEGKYDLICFFDALHDMGDPVGAATHARESLKAGGVLMLVEPNSADELAANMASPLAPISRMFYAASTLACVPGSLSQKGQAALGAQAGPRRLTAVLREAGFTQVRLATSTPLNLVMEARA
jgi:SAM-dependent methyltransferase